MCSQSSYFYYYNPYIQFQDLNLIEPILKALNQEGYTTPNAAATTGLIPAYQVQDLSASFKFLKNYNIKAGVNNLTDERYFTRRSGGYPGPGILPADGRVFYVSAGVKF